jgi:hypothetical protein
MLVFIVVGDRSAMKGGEYESNKEQERETLHRYPTRSEFS